jgi:hypothetical protein
MSHSPLKYKQDEQKYTVTISNGYDMLMQNPKISEPYLYGKSIRLEGIQTALNRREILN